jgi:hypothetical protein
VGQLDNLIGTIKDTVRRFGQETDQAKEVPESQQEEQVVDRTADKCIATVENELYQVVPKPFLPFLAIPDRRTFYK